MYKVIYVKMEEDVMEDVIEVNMEDKVEDTMEDDKMCIICLDDTKETSTYRLAEKFGCECKDVVHEDCLTTWIFKKQIETGSSVTNCIVCKTSIDTGVELPVIREMTEDDEAERRRLLQINQRYQLYKAAINILILILTAMLIIFVMREV